jgi:transcription antitermination factor NusG
MTRPMAQASFDLGDSVRVSTGNFVGYSGIIIDSEAAAVTAEMPESTDRRVKVQLDIFGRPVIVDYPTTALAHL